MERTKDNKNILIVFLLIIVLTMSVGFALLGSNLEVNATGTVAGDWGVQFSNKPITPVSKTEGVTVTSTQMNSTALSITLDATFEKPGDKIVYEFEVENTGSIDAYLKNVNLVGKTGNTEAIQLSYEVKNNDKSTTYANGFIAGETAEHTITPNSANALLNKQNKVGETTTTEKNYLTVTLEYLEEATAVSNESATYTLTLQYEQTNAN